MIRPDSQILFFIACLFILTVSSNSYSQNRSDRKLKKLAEEQLEEMNYEKALSLYKELYKSDSTDIDVNMGLGIVYINISGQHEKAIYHLKKVQQHKKEVPESYYLIGQAYHLNYEFDRSIQAFQSFKNFLKDNRRSLLIRQDVDRRIEMNRVGKELVQDPVDVEIKNSGSILNSSYDEYSPVISTDEAVMFFTSRRKGTTGNEKAPDGKFFEDIYVSINVGGKWKKPINVGQKINTASHDAVIGLSPDGQKMLIYRSDKYGQGNIYIAELKGYEWEIPEKLPEPINMRNSWEGSASISGDENILYFASDRSGGYGGKDIYRIKRLPDGGWAKAENLGPTINTPYDEDAPFIHPDGKTLYYSSSGHNTMGGFDIFRSKFAEDQWSAPENLGYPVNTVKDDIYFVLNASGSRGYFSSIRKDGKGLQDLYVVNLPYTQIEKEHVLTLVKGKITAGDIPIEAEIKVMDNESGRLVGVYRSNKATGKYVLAIPAGKNYNITIESEGYFFHSENIHFSDQDKFIEIQKDIDLLSGEMGDKILLKNIFFKPASDAIKEDMSRNELEQLYNFMIKNPMVILGITAYVSQKMGDDDLAYARAVNIMDYLLEKGIRDERVSPEGFAVDDDPEKEHLIGKVEIRILGGHFGTAVQKDESEQEIYDKLLAEFPEKTVPDLDYKVQIGAFRNPENFDFKDLQEQLWLWYIKIEKEMLGDGIVRFVAGNFEDLSDAEELRQQIIKEGVVDAWVVPYYKGSRITFKEVRKMMSR